MPMISNDDRCHLTIGQFGHGNEDQWKIGFDEGSIKWLVCSSPPPSLTLRVTKCTLTIVSSYSLRIADNILRILSTMRSISLTAVEPIHDDGAPQWLQGIKARFDHLCWVNLRAATIKPAFPANGIDRR
ncbi:hypothetical protein Bind_3105 [Beijerinckia indica subsp. indica ATCC 9039]|uniref:Uncharacterized protein n=1 Tax=Beijerinckia indica subsp. indica (strain ATCC 9039 / DSM 1715 / NCIMB 8712) TaxID=395963 RepID=B2IC69_BEII9|nr:hypothetical protein Bind_3105 [Beijerinckia indica subsp. indica ATCC 9039]